MPMNRMPFRARLSMSAFLRRYGTDTKRYGALYRTRWPQRFRCSAHGGRLRSPYRRAERTYCVCRSRANKMSAVRHSFPCRRPRRRMDTQTCIHMLGCHHVLKRRWHSHSGRKGTARGVPRSLPCREQAGFRCAARVHEVLRRSTRRRHATQPVHDGARKARAQASRRWLGTVWAQFFQ